MCVCACACVCVERRNRPHGCEPTKTAKKHRHTHIGRESGVPRGGLIYWAAKERTGSIYREEIDILVCYTHTHTHTHTHTVAFDSLISLSFLFRRSITQPFFEDYNHVCVCVCVRARSYRRRESLPWLYDQVRYLDHSRSGDLLCMKHQTPCGVCLCMNTHCLSQLHWTANSSVNSISGAFLSSPKTSRTGIGHVYISKLVQPEGPVQMEGEMAKCV